MHPIMKTFISSILVSAICASAVSALDATSVRVELPKSVNALTVHQIAAPSVTFLSSATKGKSKFDPAPSKSKPVGKQVSAVKQWQYVSFPLRVHGFPVKVGGSSKHTQTPHFVSELSVTMYALFRSHKDDKDSPLVFLTKELNYVNVPVGDINVGFMISPRDASKIAPFDNDRAKVAGDLRECLVALAIEARFNGVRCMASKKASEMTVILDKTLKSRLEGAWWKKQSFRSSSASLLGINETPFAFSFGSHFPEMSPLLVSSASAPKAATADGNDVVGAESSDAEDE